jgi:hypothetical protein
MGEYLSVGVAKQTIDELLEGLSPASLNTVVEFVRFLRAKEPLEAGPLYPTVDNPASSLKLWLDLVPAGYEGDALRDTEALYDEV